MGTPRSVWEWETRKREKGKAGNWAQGGVGGRGGANWARPLLLVLCASKQNGSILFNKLTTSLFIGRKTMAMAMAMPMSRHLIGFLCNLLSHFLFNGDIHQRNREIRDHFRLGQQ